MLASKAGSERISLKILFKDDLPANGLMFTFTSLQTREEDRRAVQDTLIPFVSANRAGPSAPAAGTVASPAPKSAGAAPSTPGAAVEAAKAKRRRAEENTPEAGPSTSTSTGKAARPANYKLRLRVLNKEPNLKMLHRELVLGKQITEEEFWDGREVSVLRTKRAF